MKIGDLARAADCNTQTIRYYEHEGLLPSPARSSGNYRLYSDTHLERLRFLRNCRALDMTHEEIRGLLAAAEDPDHSCVAANTMLREHIGHVDTRIAELTVLRAQLAELSERCRDEASGACGILKGLAALETTVKRDTHLG